MHTYPLYDIHAHMSMYANYVPNAFCTRTCTQGMYMSCDERLGQLGHKFIISAQLACGPLMGTDVSRITGSRLCRTKEPC